MTDIEQIRAFAERIRKERDVAVREQGLAGSGSELVRDEMAKELLALLDSLPAPRPALTADEVRAVVRESASVPMARHEIDVDFTLDRAIDALAEIVAVKLAGRTPEPRS